MQLTQSQAVRGWLWTLAYVGTLTPLSFIANAVLARTLGVTGFGEYSYAITVLSLGQAVIALGYGTAVGRYAAAHHGAGEDERLLRLLRAHNTLNVAWSGTAVALLVVVLVRPTLPVAALLVAAAYLSAYMESTSLALPALQRTDKAAQVALVGALTVQLTCIVLCLLTRDPLVVVAGRFVMGAALAPVRLAVLPRAVRLACLSFGVPSLPRELLRFGAVAYVSSLLSLLVYSRTEVVLLQAFDHAQAIGLFALAFGLASQVTGLVDAAAGPLTPAMTSAISRDPSSVSRLLLRAQKAVTMAVLAWGALTILPVALLIPTVYGQDFRPAAAVFLVAALGSFLQSVTAPLESFAYATKRPGLTLQAHGFGFVAGVAVALALIPPVGLYGAAIANTVGQLTSSLVLVATAARAAEASTDVRRLLLRAAVPLVLLVLFGYLALQLPLAVGLLAWASTAGVTLIALRCGVVFHWSPDEVASVRASLPRRLAPLLGRLLPAGTGRR